MRVGLLHKALQDLLDQTLAGSWSLHLPFNPHCNALQCCRCHAPYLHQTHYVCFSNCVPAAIDACRDICSLSVLCGEDEHLIYVAQPISISDVSSEDCFVMDPIYRTVRETDWQLEPKLADSKSRKLSQQHKLKSHQVVSMRAWVETHHVLLCCTQAPALRGCVQGW